MHTEVKIVSFTGRRPKYRVAVAPTKEALGLKANSPEARAAGLLVTFVQGSAAAADMALWCLFNAAHDRAKVTP